MQLRRISLLGVGAFLLSFALVNLPPAIGQSPSNGSNYGLDHGSNFRFGGYSSGDPELEKVLSQEHGVDQETHPLLEALAKTENDSERSKIKAKLTTALEKQFDLQQKRRELEVARIEAQLKKLRDLIKKRSDNRQSIVDKRLDQLIREAEGLGWSSTSPAPWEYSVFGNNPFGNNNKTPAAKP